MDKLAVLSEIHGLVQLVIETPESAFSDPDKRKDLIEQLAEYYVAIAIDRPSNEIDARFDTCRTTINTYVTDSTKRERLLRSVDDINDDLTPVP